MFVCQFLEISIESKQIGDGGDINSYLMNGQDVGHCGVIFNELSKNLSEMEFNEDISG